MKIGLQTWGSEGDIRPFLALAAGLARAGHDVTLVATEVAPRDYSEAARRGGFALRMVGSPVFRDAATTREIWRTMVHAANPLRQATVLLKQAFDPVEEVMAEAALELCRDHELVIGHYFLHSLRAAADRTGTPMMTVQLMPDFIPSRFRTPYDAPDLGRWFRPIAWKLARTVSNALLLPRVNRRRLAWGLRPHRSVLTETWISKPLTLIAVSPALFQPMADWGPEHVVCGFLHDGGEPTLPCPAVVEAFLEAGASPVYFGFGSLLPEDAESVDVIRRLWTEAVRRTGCRAIFQLPPGSAPAPSAGGPDILEIWRCPHATVFPRCAAVVHHGGAGTTQSTLLAGKPSVVVAHVADQFFWADLLWRREVGARPLVRKGLTARALADRLRQVLDHPEPRANAEALGTRLREESGVDAAVAAIGRLHGAGS